VSGGAVRWPPKPDDGLSFVGRPETVYRITTPVYADQARLDWTAYVSATLAGSQRAGGRFNPKGEFGALYTSDDEATAWEETAARFAREGVSGLPDNMRLLQITIEAGRYADLWKESVQKDFEITLDALVSKVPTEEQNEACLRLARAVRALADFLTSPSARGPGSNVALYPDSEGSGLRLSFAGAAARRVPAHLVQRAAEAW
jgi:RES domain-containing protein